MSSISITGEATEGNNDKYFLTIMLITDDWRAGEVGQTSKVFKTKAGKYIFKAARERGTALLDNDGNSIGFLTNLEPSTAKKGDKGVGRVEETGRTVKWEIESV